MLSGLPGRCVTVAVLTGFMEALREGWRSRRFTMDELDRYASICRVQRVMRPYLEALSA